MKNSKENKNSFRDSIPLWGWIIIFFLPLILSEYMFYVSNRLFSLISFPVAWVGFWWIIMYRSGWKIFKKKNKI
jgi:capsule polysaccharide export protein KpsE/RkpR